MSDGLAQILGIVLNCLIRKKEKSKGKNKKTSDASTATNDSIVSDVSTKSTALIVSDKSNTSTASGQEN